MKYRCYLFNGILAATVSLGLASCGVTLPAGNTTIRTSSYRTADIQTSKVVADLEISQARQSGKATDKVGVPIDDLKGMAISNVLSATGGDILLEPTFVVEDNGANITVIVTGYVAKYVNLRQVKGGDLKVTVVHPGKTAPVAPANPAQEKPKKKGALGLGVGGL